MRNVRSGSTIAERLEYYSTPVPFCGCRIWLGTMAGKYGQITFADSSRRGGRKVQAHRAAWTDKHGPIPPGIDVLHHCDTPLCIEDQHLFLGSNQDNINDKMAKGRHGCGRGERQGHAKLTEADVIAIRNDRSPQVDLAKKFEVSPATICKIKSRQAWSHVP